MMLQPILITLGLAPAAILYAGSAYVYHRKGVSTKAWLAIIGAYIVALFVFEFVALFGSLAQAIAIVATVTGILNIFVALRWRPE
jgi:uncharacterized membrane protein HdeD (DUF308 family)